MTTATTDTLLLPTDLPRSVSMIQLVSTLLDEAYGLGASDIHLDPTPAGLSVRYRVDGMMTDRHLLPASLRPELISRIKVLAGLRTDEHFAAQDGRFRYQAPDGERYADIRVSIAPTYHGENAVLRILSDVGQAHTLDSLGFCEADRLRIIEAIGKPDGMILSTGPTGSGKTTTLYALMRLLHAPDISIVTIEDPVEYAIEGVRQIQTQSRTGLTFAHGLRALLRQDPDVIMVGEIRDGETANTAVNTALTGHLLLSTLHTNDAASALPRLYDLGVEPYLVASTLRLVVAQRLVRRICDDCKEPAAIPESALDEFLGDGFLLDDVSLPSAWSTGVGCESCLGTGYRGRVAIGETLLVDDDIRNAILARAPAHEIKKLAQQSGMKTLRENGIEKARQGYASLAEIVSIV